MSERGVVVSSVAYAKTKFSAVSYMHPLLFYLSQPASILTNIWNTSIGSTVWSWSSRRRANTLEFSREVWAIIQDKGIEET